MKRIIYCVVLLVGFTIGACVEDGPISVEDIQKVVETRNPEKAVKKFIGRQVDGQSFGEFKREDGAPLSLYNRNEIEDMFRGGGVIEEPNSDRISFLSTFKLDPTLDPDMFQGREGKPNWDPTSFLFTFLNYKAYNFFFLEARIEGVDYIVDAVVYKGGSDSWFAYAGGGSVYALHLDGELTYACGVVGQNGLKKNSRGSSYNDVKKVYKCNLETKKIEEITDYKEARLYSDY